MDRPPPQQSGDRLISLAVELPLGRFPLRVCVELRESTNAVMGPSGAGKTSLLEVIAGLRPRAHGRVVVDGEVLLDTAAGRRLPPERRHVGYVPQDACLFPHLTVLDNVRFGARGEVRGVEAALDALEIRDLVGRYPVSLSGGEKQRVALARALASRPRVLLLDEPLAALDAPLRERVLPYLLRIRDEWKVPFVYVTHNVGEAVALGGELLLVRDGTVEAQGPPIELLAATGRFASAGSGLDNLMHGQVVAHDRTGGITHLRLDGGIDLAIPLAPTLTVGASVTIGIRAEDVLVATELPRHLSARNCFPVRVLAIVAADADAIMRCAGVQGGPEWLVRLTPAAVDGLGLVPGCNVWLAVKSHSVRVV